MFELYNLTTSGTIAAGSKTSTTTGSTNIATASPDFPEHSVHFAGNSNTLPRINCFKAIMQIMFQYETKSETKTELRLSGDGEGEH